MKKTLSILAILTLTACAGGMIPDKRTESVKATESIANQQSLMVEKITTPVAVNAEGIPVAESIKLSHTTQQDAGAKESGEYLQSPSFIALVAALIVAIGFGLLAYSAFAKSTRVGRAADGALGAFADHLNTIIATTDNADIKTQLLNLKGNIEKDRGKLARK